MPQFLFLLLALVSLAASTRQPIPSGATKTLPQTAANQDASDTPLKTADGVSVCPADSTLVGLYRVGGGVWAPTLTHAPEGTMSDEALKFIQDRHIEKFEAISLVGVTVNTHGMPQDICLVKEAGHGLDRNALEVVAKYRFKPATLDGKPVPVRVVVAVRFANFPARPSECSGSGY
jgi:TonB family protein